jgi:H+-transporting ATPase
MASTVLDFLIIGTLASEGILMAPLPLSIIAGIFAASVLLALVMDQVKVWLFAFFKMT